MRILFDLHAAQQMGDNVYHGGAEYTKAVFLRLLEKDRGCDLAVFVRGDRALDETLGCAVREHGVEVLDVRGRSEYQRVVGEARFDRIYVGVPYEFHDVPYGNTELLFTLHGIRDMELPKDRYEYMYATGPKAYARYLLKRTVLFRILRHRGKKRLARLIRTAMKHEGFVVDSTHTKYVVLSHFPFVSESDVRVFYPPPISSGAAVTDEMVNEATRKYEVRRKDYFLLISGHRWPKNAFRALEAFDGLFRQFPQIKKQVLVLGASQCKRMRSRFGRDGRFRFAGYCDRDELEALYAGGFAFVYPTLNEGFGYPPLESMRQGTPVLCSAVCSTVEVCGDAVLYFNPYSIDEIRARILQMLLQPDLPDVYAARGRRRYAEMSRRQEESREAICDWILSRGNEKSGPAGRSA